MRSGDVPEGLLHDAIKRITRVTETLTAPLRAVRRTLKDPDFNAHFARLAPLGTPSLLTEKRTAAIRTPLKDAELAAEQLEQAVLSPLSARLPFSRPSGAPERARLEVIRAHARRNLATYARIAGAGRRGRFSVTLIEETVMAIFPPA